MRNAARAERPVATSILSSLCFVLLGLFVLGMCSSCRRGTVSGPEDSKVHPQMTMANASYTIGKPDRQPLVMDAAQIRIWTGESSRTELEGVSFTQCAENSTDVVLTGSCDSAVSFDDSSVNLEGHVKLFKADDNISFSCDNLHWDDRAHTIKTDGQITVVYNDGTSIDATGFSAELDTNTYSFARINRGTFSSKDEPEGAKAEADVEPAVEAEAVKDGLKGDGDV